jgi:hypothetical protein
MVGDLGNHLGGDLMTSLSGLNDVEIIHKKGISIVKAKKKNIIIKIERNKYCKIDFFFFIHFSPDL